MGVNSGDCSAFNWEASVRRQSRLLRGSVENTVVGVGYIGVGLEPQIRT